MNTLQNKIPDFAVSKEEKGFNELAIILVNKFHLSKLPPNYDYYGVRNNEFEAVSKAGTLWTNNIISPQSAIALLTGKQLTEGENTVELFVDKFFDEKTMYTRQSIIKCVNNFSTQQTTHLQQQLKEAKELLSQCNELIEELKFSSPLNKPVSEQIILLINQFLTRNK